MIVAIVSLHTLLLIWLSVLAFGWLTKKIVEAIEDRQWVQGHPKLRAPRPKLPPGEKRAILWMLGSMALCLAYLTLAIAHVV